jgi:SAM-dependent methyltransferase
LIAREKLPFPIFHGSLDDYNPDPDTFDVVTLWNVLEHLPHPVDDLRHISQVMKVGGLLVISIPNLESLCVGFFKTRWLGWDLPRHLYFFPRDLLVDVLHSIGFRVIGLQCIAGSHAAFGHTLGFWSQDWMGANQRLCKLLLNIYNSLPFRILMSMPFWVLAQLRLSPNITVFAQKVHEYENDGNPIESEV